MDKTLAEVYREAKPAQKRLSVLFDFLNRNERTRKIQSWMSQDKKVMDFFHATKALTVLPLYPEKHEFMEQNALYPSFNGRGTLITSRTNKGHSKGIQIDNPVFSRWIILLHECSHQEMRVAHKPDVIRAALPAAVRQDMVNWSFLPSDGSDGSSSIEEAFADCYSIMLLTQALKGDAQASTDLEKAVDQFREQREKEQEKEEKEFVISVDRDELEYLVSAPSIHNTGWALGELSKNRNKWIELDPQETKEYAMELATRQWKRDLNIFRTTKDGFPLGLALRMYSLPEHPNSVMRKINDMLSFSLRQKQDVASIKAGFEHWPEHYRKLGLMALDHQIKKPSCQNYPSLFRWSNIIAEDKTGTLKAAMGEAVSQWKQARTRIAQGFIVEPAQRRGLWDQYFCLGRMLDYFLEEGSPTMKQKTIPDGLTI